MKAKVAGLMVFPRTKEDTQVIGHLVDKSDFIAEYNSEFGCFFFPEEEENYDCLEIQIDEMLIGTNANYRVEGVF